MTQVADAFVRYLADTKDLQKTIGPGGAVAAAGEKGATQVGARFKNALTGISTGAGIAGGAFFVTALEGATKLEDQMRTVNTVAGLSDSELGNLTDSVQALSRETGASTDDLTAGLYDLVSAGVPAGEAIGVLRDSAKLAIGALGTTGESVDAVTSALNAYGLGASESTRVTDILAKAVADGKVTISEIGGTIANIAPIAASAGVSLEEVSAGFAILTAKGVPAAQAATQMRAAISALLTPNEQLNAIQKETGINFAELAKTKGLAVALEELRKATGGNAEAFAKSLGSIEAYQFALQSTGENAETFQDQITETVGAVGTATDQYEEKSKSAAESGKRLFATINTFAQDVGGPFVETLGGGAFALNELGKAFGIPIAPARLLGAVFGGVIGRAIPALISGFAGLLPLLAPIVTTVFGGLAAVASAALALWPVLLVAAIVAGILFLVNNPDVVASILAFVEDFLGWLGEFLAALPGLLVDLFVGAIGKVIEILPTLLLRIAELILSLPGRLLGLQFRIVQLFIEMGPKIAAAVIGFVVEVAKLILSIPGRIAALGTQIGKHFARVAREGIANVGRLVGKVVELILSIPGKAASWVGSILGQVGRLVADMNQKIRDLVASVVRFFLSIPGRIAEVGGRIVSGIIRGMASLPGRIADTIRRAFANLRIDIGPFHISSHGVSIDLPKIDLPSFAVGSSFVPEDMLAVVHRGEIIIPREEAEAIRAGRTTLGRSLPAAAAVSTPGGGSTYNITVPIEGLAPVRNSGDIITRLRMVAEAGILAPNTASPRYPVRSYGANR